MLSFMNGSIVFCFTLASSLMTTCPPRWIIPKTGGLSFSNVPRPLLPLRRRRRPLRPLLHHFRLSFMASDHIGFIALYLVGQRQRSSVSIPNLCIVGRGGAI